MTVWVDADGCPAEIRRIVERAAVRLGIEAVFVAAKPVEVAAEPASALCWCRRARARQTRTC